MEEDFLKPIVLVIEDDRSIADSLIPSLKEEGFKVLYADNGEDGLSLALGNRPNVILLDLGLPKLDGLSVFKKLRQDDWGKEAKVLIFSVNDPDHNILQEINDLKPAYYLVKSNWSLEEVVKRIKELIQP